MFIVVLLDNGNFVLTMVLLQTPQLNLGYSAIDIMLCLCCDWISAQGFSKSVLTCRTSPRTGCHHSRSDITTKAPHSDRERDALTEEVQRFDVYIPAPCFRLSKAWSAVLSLSSLLRLTVEASRRTLPVPSPLFLLFPNGIIAKPSGHGLSTGSVQPWSSSAAAERNSEDGKRAEVLNCSWTG